MAQSPAHSITLSPPADPGGKGDAGRWVLNAFHYPAGQRTALYGPRPDEADKAKAMAAEVLGYEPEWIAIGQGFAAANPEDHQPKKETRP